MENELYHYGSLGMKWGLRRYQNYDGSLTDEGKIRYGKNIEKHYEKASDKLNSYRTKQLNSEKKSLKYEKKSSKTMKKAEKYAGKGFDENDPAWAAKYAVYNKMLDKADAYNSTSSAWKDKALIYKQRGEEWVKKMDRAFAAIDIRNIPQKDIESGKAYVNYIDMLQIQSTAKENLEAANEYLRRSR